MTVRQKTAIYILTETKAELFYYFTLLYKRILNKMKEKQISVR